MKVLFFYANWDNSSNKMYSTFVGLSKRFNHSRFTFEFVDVDTKEGADLSCKYEVRNVCAILFVNKKGKIIERIKGVQEYETLVETCKKYMK